MNQKRKITIKEARSMHDGMAFRSVKNDEYLATVTIDDDGKIKKEWTKTSSQEMTSKTQVIASIIITLLLIVLSYSDRTVKVVRVFFIFTLVVFVLSILGAIVVYARNKKRKCKISTNSFTKRCKTGIMIPKEGEMDDAAGNPTAGAFDTGSGS